MKNSDRNIDDFFKSNLENRNFKMDDQHLEDLENQLDKINNPKNIDEFYTVINEFAWEDLIPEVEDAYVSIQSATHNETIRDPRTYFCQAY